MVLLLVQRVLLSFIFSIDGLLLFKCFQGRVGDLLVQFSPFGLHLVLLLGDGGRLHVLEFRQLLVGLGQGCLNAFQLVLFQLQAPGQIILPVFLISLALFHSRSSLLHAPLSPADVLLRVFHRNLLVLHVRNVVLQDSQLLRCDSTLQGSQLGQRLLISHFGLLVAQLPVLDGLFGGGQRVLLLDFPHLLLMFQCSDGSFQLLLLLLVLGVDQRHLGLFLVGDGFLDSGIRLFRLGQRLLISGLRLDQGILCRHLIHLGGLNQCLRSQQFRFGHAQLFDTRRLVVVNTSGEYRGCARQHAGSNQISPLFHKNSNSVN